MILLFLSQIFNCILSLRSNEFAQVGYLEEGGVVRFSPFFVCRQYGGCGDHASIVTPMLLDYRTTFSAVMACLEKVRLLREVYGIAINYITCLLTS